MNFEQGLESSVTFPEGIIEERDRDRFPSPRIKDICHYAWSGLVYLVHFEDKE